MVRNSFARRRNARGGRWHA